LEMSVEDRSTADVHQLVSRERHDSDDPLPASSCSMLSPLQRVLNPLYTYNCTW
jgi:hypothetical protein